MAACGHGAHWPVWQIVHGAEIQLGELWGMEEGVAMGQLRSKVPEPPLGVGLWEVIQGVSWVLPEEVKPLPRFQILGILPQMCRLGKGSPLDDIEHAERAGVVLLQPGVDTLSVELMGTGNNPQLLALAELLQTDSADGG